MTRDHAEGRDRPTIHDVARAAGVSSMTVSRVLNRRPGVGDATRARVRETMARLGYRPNPSAVALKLGHSRVLAYVGSTTELRGPLVDTLMGLEAAAAADGWSVLLQPLNDVTPESLRRVRRRLRSNAVDVAVVMAPFEATAAELRELDSDIPSVGLWTPPGALPLTLGARHAELGAELATRYLLGLGHRTVAFVSGPSGWLATRYQAMGWRRILEEEGRETIPPEPADWTAQSGYDVGLRLLLDPRVTAVLAVDDSIALGIVHAARDLGRRVPEDVSVMGYGDHPHDPHLDPPLSSVSHPLGLMGEHAYQAAMVRIGVRAHDELPPEPAPELRIRRSTAPPRRR